MLTEKTVLTIDAEDPEFIQSIPEDDIERRLRWLRAMAQRPDQRYERESDLGLPQTEVDKLTHRSIGEGLQALIPGSRVCGEESTTSEWDHALSQDAGGYVWNLDAIDGSGPQDTLGFGYSSNVILYRVREDQAVPVLMGTMTSSGIFLGWVQSGSVNVAKMTAHETWELKRIVSPLADIEVVRNERQHFIATVSAKPQTRQLLRPLFDSSVWTVQTLGGAPAMPWLLLGKLSALIIPTDQTRHDAAPLLALASQMGLFFVELRTGNRLCDDTVRRFFGGLSRPRTPRYTPIPAMIVARDEAIAKKLLYELQPHWLTEMGFDGAAAVINLPNMQPRPTRNGER